MCIYIYIYNITVCVCGYGRPMLGPGTIFHPEIAVNFTDQSIIFFGVPGTSRSQLSGYHRLPQDTLSMITANSKPATSLADIHPSRRIWYGYKECYSNMSIWIKPLWTNHSDHFAKIRSIFWGSPPATRVDARMASIDLESEEMPSINMELQMGTLSINGLYIVDVYLWMMDVYPYMMDVYLVGLCWKCK